MISTLPRSRRRLSHDPEIRRARSNHRLQFTARYLLLAVLMVAPWIFGGALFVTQQYLYAALLLCGVLWLGSHLIEKHHRGHRYQLPLLILPVAIGVIFGTIQLLPLSSLANQPLGPPIADDLPLDAATAGFTRDAISIYPLQTRVSIASLSFALLAFFLASQLFADNKSQLLLFGAIALSGLALSFFGLVHKLSGHDHSFWYGTEVIDGKPFSAWVNRNNAAGYLNLTFAAACGMLVWASFHKNTRSVFEYDLINDTLNGRIVERMQNLFASLARIRGSQLLFGLSLVVIAAGVIASSSRGGILSLGVGLLAAVIWLFVKKESRLAVSICVVVLVPTIGLLSWLGISGGVTERFKELELSRIQQTARFQNWSETLQGMPEIWKTGSGLGTYRYFYQPYQHHKAEGVYEHAENQYVETLIEGGVVGLGLVVIAIVLGYAAVFRLSSSRLIGREDGVALVGLVALTTQCSQSFLDFGLLLPANMLLMAVIMGAITGRAAHKLAGGRGSWRITFPRMSSKATPALFAVLLIGNGVFGWIEISRAALAEQALREVAEVPIEQDTVAHNQQQIDRLLKVLEYRPDDTDLLTALSDAYVRSYQLAVRNQMETRLGRKLSDSELKGYTSLEVLYQQVNELERNDQSAHAEYLVSRKIVSENLVPARSALTAADAACAWLPKVELLRAYLSILDEPADKRLERLERVVYLAPYSPQYLYPVGFMAHASGDDKLSLFAWKRTYILDHKLRYQLLLMFPQKFPELTLSRDFLPKDASVLRQTIEYPMVLKAHPEIVEECLLCADELLGDGQTAVSVDELFLDGFRKHWRGRPAEAIEPLQKAVDHDPPDLRAGSLLIELLVKTGNPEQAEKTLNRIKEPLSNHTEYDRLPQLIEDAKNALKARQEKQINNEVYHAPLGKTPRENATERVSD